MKDARAMTFGVDFGLDEAVNRLNEAVGRIEAMTESFQETELAAQQMRETFETSVDRMTIGTEQLNEQTENYGKVGAQAVDHVTDAMDEAAQGAKDASEAFQDVVEAQEEVADGAKEVGNEAQEAAEQLGEETKKLQEHYRKLGAEAETFGAAAKQAATEAAREMTHLSEMIEAGLQGALGHAGGKFKNFITQVKGGAKDFVSFWKGPKDFLEKKMVSAIKDSIEAEDELGENAKDAAKDVEKIGDSGENAGAAIKDAFKGAIQTMMGIEAVKGVLDKVKEFTGAAIQAAAATEGIGAKFDTVFGENAEAVGEWTDNFSDAIHRSEFEVKGFLTSSRAVASEMGITGEAADSLAKITTSLGYDLGAAFKMEDAEALEALQQGLRGDAEAMGQFGVSLDEATLKAQALKMGISEEISELDDATLTQIRMNSILEQTRDIQQAAAGETEGLVNSTKGLNAIYTDFMANAGSRFTPVIENLFRQVSDALPTIEPILMGFVDILSQGMSEAIPVLLQLGGDLIPTLTSTLGTLFQAGTPLISVFSSLAGSVLPPLANIFGLIGQTFLPPVVDILDTLNTSVIQPLMPHLQHLAEMLLPPIADLLGLISPLLEIISPVLDVIGSAIGKIAEGLGSAIGWLADKGGKVFDFFAGLSGGAKEGNEQISELGSSLEELNKVSVSPKVEIPDSATIPVSVEVTQPDVAVQPSVSDTSYTVMTNVEQAQIAQPKIQAADTKDFSKSVSMAMTNSEKEANLTWTKIQKSTTDTLAKIGSAAKETFELISSHCEDSWNRIVSLTERGAESVIAAFRQIGDQSILTPDISLTMADQVGKDLEIPHNARGTDDFQGGWTHINEEGGELAFLPEGTSIIPADKSQQLITKIKNSNNRKETPIHLNITNNITIGEVPKNSHDLETLLAMLKERLGSTMEEMAKEIFQKHMDDAYTDESIQEAY